MSMDTRASAEEPKLDEEDAARKLVCMYVCIYIYIYTHTHTYIYIYIQTHIYIYKHMYEHICVLINMKYIYPHT